jgi:dTDP-4-amino-4,6-dideoxygalactose transaminase
MRDYPLMVPSLLPADAERVASVIRSGQLVQGREVASLEEWFRGWSGSRHAIAVTNGTATMHLTLHAMGIGPGDEVIVPAFSYIATANVVELTGATPVFADIDPATFNVGVDAILERITPRTRAILPVHEFGLSCDIGPISELAAREGIPLIEDAACALGARYRDRPVGTFGIAGSFSLHPRKSVTSGEGGVVTTDDDALAAALRRLRNHGAEIVDGVMDFTVAGFNCRMTDLQAALVNGQLERLSGMLQTKERLAMVYLEELDRSRMRLPHVPADRNHTWQTFHVVLDERVDRDAVMAALRQVGIGTNYGAQCIPATRHYRAKYGFDPAVSFPNAYEAFTKGLAIPLYNDLTENDIRHIASNLNKAAADATR